MTILEHLKKLYGDNISPGLAAEFEKHVSSCQIDKNKRLTALPDERTVMLITYADQFYMEGEKRLQTFKRFADAHLKGVFSGIHFLPFFPYSSDDGFSVIDYTTIDDRLGEWNDVEQFSKDYIMMYDFVCNHISSKSKWFRDYLDGVTGYESFFIEKTLEEDHSMVTRPRTSPLLTPFQTSQGLKYLWTTFSADQLDLNYSNPKVLLKALDVFLSYLEKGASWIRMDAIGFLWKSQGTSCMHLPQTHQVIKLFRSIMEQVLPEGRIVAEVNACAEDNLTYFGNGDESHMVYQFPLPIMVLYSFYNGQAQTISNWARQLPLLAECNTYFNFLASHDGVGINPIRGIVPEQEISLLLQRLQQEADARISFKENPDGSKSAYEINVSYLSALRGCGDEKTALQKTLTAHAILLSMAGVPAVYIHSFLGSQNYEEGIKLTGQNRTVNREKFQYEALEAELQNPETFRAQVMCGIAKLISVRKGHSAFAPKAKQQFPDLAPEVFSILRTSNSGEKILCIHNFSAKQIKINHYSGIDLLDGKHYSDEMILPSYGFLWIAIS